jgi:hypothetical protein
VSLIVSHLILMSSPTIHIVSVYVLILITVFGAPLKSIAYLNIDIFFITIKLGVMTLFDVNTVKNYLHTVQFSECEIHSIPPPISSQCYH